MPSQERHGGQFEWAVLRPVASLHDSNCAMVGNYYAGPTWEAGDGSKVRGKQVAVSPASAANIPLQLVKADPAIGSGAMQGVTHIQRINTRGGIAPTDVCGTANLGARMPIKYEADYLFYKKSWVSAQLIIGHDIARERVAHCGSFIFVASILPLRA